MPTSTQEKLRIRRKFPQERCSLPGRCGHRPLRIVLGFHKSKKTSDTQNGLLCRPFCNTFQCSISSALIVPVLPDMSGANFLPPGTSLPWPPEAPKRRFRSAWQGRRIFPESSRTCLRRPEEFQSPCKPPRRFAFPALPAPSLSCRRHSIPSHPPYNPNRSRNAGRK